MNNVFVSSKISEEEESNLIKLRINPIKIPISKKLPEEIWDHPDMLLNIIDEKNIIVHKDMDKSFTLFLSKLNYNIHFSDKILKNKYPEDIILNGLNLKDIFIHKLDSTDPKLLSLVKGKKLINTRQGYSKCSTAVLSDDAFITSDDNMERILLKEGKKVLKVPYGDIILKGYDYGFIGGCCGLIGKGVLAFYGDLSFYKYGEAVLNFLKENEIEAVYLRNGKLIDRGSIMKIW
ncbi:MAG: hypothetical protein LIR50_11340 [Bacillota bacterium]|nr:hypothetical protein [Bacillota bacterium]